MSDSISPSCPLPETGDLVLLGHGSGGQMMQQLLRDHVFSIFSDPQLTNAGDSAVLNNIDGQLAFTTDSYVVTPRFFPGGDIGTLAVHGTVNDLAVSGAEPLYLSCSFILEEGLPVEELRRVVRSMKTAADHCGVRIVTGDTKVVERGKADGIFINTAGVGRVIKPLPATAIAPGDAILVSGDIGRHGMAIMSAREGLSFDAPIASDCGDLSRLCRTMIDNIPGLRCMRDLTRGGLATNVREWCDSAGVEILLEENAVPVDPVIRGACELLGLEPFHLACEGRMAIVVDTAQANTALALLHEHGAASACKIGEVTEGPRPRLIARTAFGGERVVERLPGQQLPRIC